MPAWYLGKQISTWKAVLKNSRIKKAKGFDSKMQDPVHCGGKELVNEQKSCRTNPSCVLAGMMADWCISITVLPPDTTPR